jgi:hypothetical protein
LLENDALEVTESGTTLRTPLDLAANVRAAFDGADETQALAAIPQLTRLGAAAKGTWQAVKPVCDAWLSGTLAAELNASGNSNAVLAHLARVMLDDEESIAASEVELSAPLADAANTGDGVMAATILVVMPGADTPTLSQLVRAQSIEAVCVADHALDGTAEGREAWILRAASGEATSAETIPVTTGDAEDPRNLIIDGSFTAYASGDFAHWIATGAEVFAQETSDTRFDSKALRIESDADGAATLTQVLSERSSAIPGGGMLALGAHIKAIGVTAGSVTMRVTVNGTPRTGTIVIDNATPAAAWLHRSAWVHMPRIASSDVVLLEIMVSADFDGVVLVDGLSMAAPDVGPDGVSVAIFQGVRAFSRAPFPDRFVFACDNDEEGAFAGFMRDVYGVELPSSDTPTIDDGLAV